MGMIESALVAVFAWLALNFLGRPVLAVREKRLEAIQVADRYSNVSFTSSDELRATAVRSLYDVACALRTYSREASIATRLWCRLMKYDLDLAARCLLGLAEGARGEYRVSEEQRKNTLNALYVSLGAMSHLTRAEIDAVRRVIAEADVKVEGQPD
jgi:hypothetical protein